MLLVQGIVLPAYLLVSVCCSLISTFVSYAKLYACHFNDVLKYTGMAVARDLLGKKNNIVSVIGDGAMTAGQAYEALNNAGYLDTNLIVILNDNKQVSLPTATLDGPATPVGALSRALAKLQAFPDFRKLRETAKVNAKP